MIFISDLLRLFQGIEATANFSCPANSETNQCELFIFAASINSACEKPARVVIRIQTVVDHVESSPKS